MTDTTAADAFIAILKKLFSFEVTIVSKLKINPFGYDKIEAVNDSDKTSGSDSSRVKPVVILAAMVANGGYLYLRKKKMKKKKKEMKAQKRQTEMERLLRAQRFRLDNVKFNNCTFTSLDFEELRRAAAQGAAIVLDEAVQATGQLPTDTAVPAHIEAGQQAPLHSSLLFHLKHWLTALIGASQEAVMTLIEAVIVPDEDFIAPPEALSRHLTNLQLFQLYKHTLKPTSTSCLHYRLCSLAPAVPLEARVNYAKAMKDMHAQQHRMGSMLFRVMEYKVLVGASILALGVYMSARLLKKGFDDKVGEAVAITAAQQADAAFRAKNWGEAISFYTVAIQLGANNTTYYTKRAQAFMHLNMFNLANEGDNKATTLDEKNVGAYFLRGTAQEKLGHNREADEDFIHSSDLGQNQNDQITDKSVLHAKFCSTCYNASSLNVYINKLSIIWGKKLYNFDVNC